MVFLHPDAHHFLALTAGSAELDTRSPSENRRAQESTRHLMGKHLEVAAVYDTEIAKVAVRVYHPSGAKENSPVFLFFHGGGWVLGDLESADSTVRDIARQSGVVCISVDYRRAPEHPFPLPLEDCLSVTDAVLAEESGISVDPNKVAIGGDSAGGNIAAVVAQERRAQIRHQILVYPVMDLSGFHTQSHKEFATGFFLTRRRLSYFYDCYAGHHDRLDPRLSPLLTHDLQRMPTTTIISAECDPLVDEAKHYAEKLLESGNIATTIQFKGQVHPFVQMSSIIDDALVARRIIAAELRAALGTEAN